MHYCKDCDYFTTSNKNLKNHFKSQKHLTNTKQFNCVHCNKQYKYKNSLTKHITICIKNSSITNNINDVQELNDYKLEIEKLKKEKENEIEKLKKENENEIEKLKNKNKIQKLKDKYKRELLKEKHNSTIALKEQENKHLQINNQTNCNNTIINNTIKISNLDFLNSNFSNVIDIYTFTENYKNKFGLTKEQSFILLENYKNTGINSCIASIVYYLKKSAIEQYKELKGVDVAIENVILPFILSDKCLRDHFEKSNTGLWDKTTIIDNVRKIITITNDQIFKHHNELMFLHDSQKKRVVNGVLKASGYSRLAEITIPELYKSSIDNIMIE
jgi:hypothetical protein